MTLSGAEVALSRAEGLRAGMPPGRLLARRWEPESVEKEASVMDLRRLPAARWYAPLRPAAWASKAELVPSTVPAGVSLELSGGRADDSAVEAAKPGFGASPTAMSGTVRPAWAGCSSRVGDWEPETDPAPSPPREPAAPDAQDAVLAGEGTTDAKLSRADCPDRTGIADMCLAGSRSLGAPGSPPTPPARPMGTRFPACPAGATSDVLSVDEGVDLDLWWPRTGLWRSLLPLREAATSLRSAAPLADRKLPAAGSELCSPSLATPPLSPEGPATPADETALGLHRPSPG